MNMRTTFSTIAVSIGLVFTVCCNILLANETNFIYDSKNKRDPFVPLIGVDVKLTDVELLESINDVKVEGVIVDPEHGSAAIINSEILKIGDYLGGFRLKNVLKNAVILEREGKEFKLIYRKNDT